MRRPWVWVVGAVCVVALTVAVLVALVDAGEEMVMEDTTVETVFVGDSITRGVSPETQTFSVAHSWVTYAIEDDRSPWELQANTALFGLTLLQMESSFRDSVVNQAADGVVIMGGTNDVLQDIPTDQSISALRTMIESAQAEGIEVWVVAPTPLNASYGRSIAELVEAEEALTHELGVAFVDPAGAVSGPAGEWRPGLTTDGVHPTADGASAIADAVIAEFGR